jgi:hypothetical protein
MHYLGMLDDSFWTVIICLRDILLGMPERVLLPCWVMQLALALVRWSHHKNINVYRAVKSETSVASPARFTP